MDGYGDGTRAIHAGRPEPVAGQPMLPGPVFAGPFHLGPAAPGGGGAGGGEGAGGADFYGRHDNPTLRGYEAALSALEGGRALVLPSGMAATAAVLLGVVRAGDRVVLPADGYFGVREFTRDELVRFAVEVVEVPTVDIAAFAAGDEMAGVRLVVLESPSNPGLDVCDIAAVSAAAHRHGALVAVDNTTATPLGQRPLALGADLSFASDTKALTGHSDLLLGHVATTDEVLADRLRTWRTRTGAVPGPFEVWLAHRSLGTLDLRLARQATNAGAVAAALAAHPAVQGLRYPWLAADPSHELATRQMLRPNGVLSFCLPDAGAVARFIEASRLAVAATSFGGLHTTVDRRAQWGGDDVAEGFVRLSCGCEDTPDLVADLIAAADSLLSGR